MNRKLYNERRNGWSKREKSPDDYLTINDFYKVYGYCCFYQSDTEHVCEILPEELTITFICNHYPRNLIQHLEKVRKLRIKKEFKVVSGSNGSNNKS